jgi:hypothetical protein
MNGFMEGLFELLNALAFECDKIAYTFGLAKKASSSAL